jgi:hypothetical protein
VSGHVAEVGYLSRVHSLFTRGLAQLPDHPKLLRELRLLERRTHRSGKDSVDHPRGQHDDFSNSCCGALHLVGRIAARSPPKIVSPGVYSKQMGWLTIRLAATPDQPPNGFMNQATPTAAHAIPLPANGEHHAESRKLNPSRPSVSRICLLTVAQDFLQQ